MSRANLDAAFFDRMWTFTANFNLRWDVGLGDAPVTWVFDFANAFFVFDDRSIRSSYRVVSLTTLPRGIAT